MEKIYNSTLLPYSSRLVCLKDFYESAHTLIQPYVQDKLTQMVPPLALKKREEYMLPLLGDKFDPATFKKLTTACMSSRFKVEGQRKEINISVSKRQRMLEKSEIPEDTQLETLKIRSSRNCSLLLRYTPSIWLDHLMSESWDVDVKRNDLVPGESLVVVLKVYHPFKHKIGEPMNRVPQACQEIVVLGHNTLAQFRDKISCLADNIVSFDVSESPSVRADVNGIEKYPSGMFFINNNFYVDKRQPESIDYSEIIKDWAKRRNIKLGETFLMEDTRLEDMSVRLGYPYLYQHQGNCEHLICFTDVRILHESDPLQSSAYPLITCYFRRNVPHCMCCTNSVARWLTAGNKRLPHDPFYFCEQCFLSFNYIDGRKVGEFKAYPFESCDSNFASCD